MTLASDIDNYFGATDDEARAAVGRIVSQWPIQLPHPDLDAGTCINAVTGEELPSHIPIFNRSIKDEPL